MPVFPGCQPLQMSACSLPRRPAVELRNSKRQGRGHHLFRGRDDSAGRTNIVSGTSPHQPQWLGLYMTLPSVGQTADKTSTSGHAVVNLFCAALQLPFIEGSWLNIAALVLCCFVAGALIAKRAYE